MPKKIYIVDLTNEERTQLLDFIKSGKQSARKLSRARILLLADEGKADSEIAEALHTGSATVARTRQRFVEGNLEGANVADIASAEASLASAQENLADLASARGPGGQRPG
jgi:hypothetical protein